jgi:cytidine deaminase
MMHWRTSLCWLFFFYTCMFFLYWLWELVRACQPPDGIEKKKVEYAYAVNLVFFIVSGLITLAYWLLRRFPASGEYVCLATVVVLVLSYRIPISIIYSRRVRTSDNLQEGQHKMNNGSPSDVDNDLAERAKTASTRARAHLSHFRVGAAVLSESGSIYVGCNIEFDNYSNTLHAEEVAISAMIAAGDSKPVKVAVFTHTQEPCFPCGMCRQSLFELGGNDLVVLACTDTKIEQARIVDLMPSAFHL